MKPLHSAHSSSVLLILLMSSLPLTLPLSGCLKSRMQLREDEGSVPNKTEPVTPQGGYAIDEVKGELTRLNGRIEDLERTNRSDNKAKTDEQLKSMENRIRELEQAQIASIEAIKKIQNDMPPPDNSILVQKGKEALKAKKYEDAAQEFSAYLKNPNGHLAEDAYFYRGEAYYLGKHYKKAIVDFSKFPEKYTKSQFMPKALLRIAQSFDAMGSKEDASAFYAQLLEEYPKSPEAKEARKKSGGKKKVK